MYFYINLQQSSTVEKINYTWGYCAPSGGAARQATAAMTFLPLQRPQQHTHVSVTSHPL